MQILFIDESGTPPAKTRAAGDFFVLGGVVVPEDAWTKLAADLVRIKKAYAVFGELKWRYFAPDRGGKATSISHLPPERKESLRVDLYKALTAYKAVKIISVVTNTELAYQEDHVDSPESMYWLAYKQITERFQYHLQDLSRTVGRTEHGIVVCDNRGPKDDENLRNLHARLMNTKASNISKYGNVIEGLFIAPSHLSVGIQFADLVAGAIYRAAKMKDMRFYDQIASAFRRSPQGKLEGYGVVKFPRGNWKK